MGTGIKVFFVWFRLLFIRVGMNGYGITLRLS